MGIEDIQISEELETNAPSIKYSGNEGPKSPQEMEQMMMAQLEEEYSKYVNDMLEQGIEPMSLRQDQYYLTDRWQRMVVSWVLMVENNMVLDHGFKKQKMLENNIFLEKQQ